MSQYVIRRLALIVPTLFGGVTLVFVIMRLVPGDVARLILAGGPGADAGGQGVDPEALAALRKELGLDASLGIQYLDFLRSLARVDLGNSLYGGASVWEEIVRRMPFTIELAILSILLLVVIAVPAGILSAHMQNTNTDYAVRVATIIGICVPNFWLGILVIIALVRVFDWLPPLLYVPLWDDPATNLTQMVIPATVIGASGAAVTARMTRSAMLEVMREDYIRTAWAKGLGERTVLTRHALKNAVLPVVTLVGNVFAVLLGGTVVIEIVFNVPGLGRLLIDAIQRRDYPVIEGVMVILVLVVTIVNLMVDLAYAALDPRIRYA